VSSSRRNRGRFNNATASGWLEWLNGHCPSPRLGHAPLRADEGARADGAEDKLLARNKKTGLHPISNYPRFASEMSDETGKGYEIEVHDYQIHG
jgi:hypothetical protein